MLNKTLRTISIFLAHLALSLLLAGASWGQQPAGSLQGSVVDESGAVIAGASVKVRQGPTVVRRLKTDEQGNFSVPGLAAGEYSIRVAADGFERFKSAPQRVVAGNSIQLSVMLKVLATKQQVTVSSDQPGTVSLESADNANAIVLQQADLNSLPDDAEELMADLQALAGPAAGSNPTQVYVNGFSSHRLPPKSALHEVRINQDPFSAQYDKVGFGRIEVFSKPGTQQYHGTAQFKMSDAVLNSRNPYVTIKPPYQAKEFTGNLGGPLRSRASFFLDFEGRWGTDNEVVNATILDPSLRTTPLMQAVLMPDSEQSASARIDYKLSDKHNLTGRYEWDRLRQANAGVGGFTLASRAYGIANDNQTFQLTEDAVLSNTAINQTRFQFMRSHLGQNATSFAPTIQVLDAFTSGGAQVGNSLHSEDLVEFQNYTTKTMGAHTLTFGGQFHRTAIYDNSAANFGGTFVFSGGLAPELNGSNQEVVGPTGNPILIQLSSIQRYQRTLLLQQAGLPLANVLAWGGGASQFSMAAGQPVSALTQIDAGLFLQDSWRIAPSLALNAGLRWEGQNDIHDWKDFAPRFGLAWSPGGAQSKTVIRMGAGMFYDRFPDINVLQTLRFDGQTQQQFVINDPNFFPRVPTLASLQAMGLPQTVRTLAPDLRAPYLIQASASVEREMPLGMLASVTYIGTWGRHQLVSQNITPLGAGLITNAAVSNINYQYASAGVLNENQFVASVRRSFHSGFAIFGRYEYGRAFGNTDGINTFPANQYDLQRDYGRTATDIRHTLVVGGSLLGPFGTSLYPFLVVRSGAPFNITTGHDNNGDTLFTDRPAFATRPNQPGVMVTPFGSFDSNRTVGAAIIPHNYGQGPGFAMLNLRLSRTFGFGDVQGNGKMGSSTHAALGGLGRRLFAAPSEGYRYNLTLGIIVRNLFNDTNAGLPVGNLSSPSFGRSNWLASTAGPADIAFGNNRRLQLQVRFDF